MDENPLIDKTQLQPNFKKNKDFRIHSKKEKDTALANSFQENINKTKLKNDIIFELKRNGFKINGNELEHENTKSYIRNLHKTAVQEMRNKYKKRLESKESDLIKYIANPSEIDVNNVYPDLVYVDSNHRLWDLFNYIKIHWSIPVSKGYGRRLCYIVFDKNNNKVIGILGLQDPVFNIKNRDEEIGWTFSQRKQNIKMVLDGYVIGAIPPYNQLLGGKLVASLLFSNKVRDDFQRKYLGNKAIISGRNHHGDLALLTTLSAFGKSSMYDRIKLPNGQQYISIGYSMGWGEFHFNGKIYNRMKKIVNFQKSLSSSKKKGWNTGFRNKREVVVKALNTLNIPTSFNKHGVKREQFLIPLAKNYKEVLKNNETPEYYNISVSEISEYMKERWLIPRSKRDNTYLSWEKKDYILWNK